MGRITVIIAPLVVLPPGAREVVRPLFAGFRPLHGGWRRAHELSVAYLSAERGAVTRVEAAHGAHGRHSRWASWRCTPPRRDGMFDRAALERRRAAKPAGGR